MTDGDEIDETALNVEDLGAPFHAHMTNRRIFSQLSFVDYHRLWWSYPTREFLLHHLSELYNIRPYTRVCIQFGYLKFDPEIAQQSDITDAVFYKYPNPVDGH